MNGRAEVDRQRRRLEATFERAARLGADAELMADFARYLCVLVSGLLEQSVIELALEHVRVHSHASVQRHVEGSLRRFTTANAQRITDLLGGFEPDWRRDLEAYLVDEHKDAVDSVVSLRQAVSHGRSVAVTMARARRYYERVREVIDHIADLCQPK